MNYNILHSVANGTTKSFSRDLDIYTHHFPGNPMMPGALSGHLISLACGGPEWALVKTSGLRFRKPLIPEIEVSISNEIKEQTAIEKTCVGKILSGHDIIADGEFVFRKIKHPQISKHTEPAEKAFRSGTQVRAYLPHGEPIVLIDQMVTATYPEEFQEFLSGKSTEPIDQAKLVGTKIHTKSFIGKENFWLHGDTIPSMVLCELVAQAGALTLSPIFTGTKPQVSLLGSDAEFFGLAQAGATIDSYLELTRSKRLGKAGNMIIFQCECFVGDVIIANITINAMAAIPN